MQILFGHLPILYLKCCFFMFFFKYKFDVLHNQMSLLKKILLLSFSFRVVFVSFIIIKYFFYQIMACLHHDKKKVAPNLALRYSREDFLLDVFCKFSGSSTNKTKRHHIHVHLYMKCFCKSY